MKGKAEIRNSKFEIRNKTFRTFGFRISDFGLTTYLLLLLLSFLLLNCSGIKSSWTNFRAHYNSYYNAEKSFKTGMQKVRDQPVVINPELPVRVHSQPPSVDASDFDNTIDKGAHILRKFPESKWVDEALFLIGKSYYYKGNFFLAIEQFEELADLAETSELRQQAAIWKARSLLDLEQYDEGVTHINSVLDEDFWSTAARAEMRVLLAQHHTLQDHWEEAADHLGETVARFEEGKIKGRVFFLYGQVLERLERYGEAFFAYDNVASRFPEYDYVYWSRLKKAEVARKEGNLDTALSIYTAMSRDDKNFDRLDRINYEIARTREMQGDFVQAEQGYNAILRSDRTAASPNVEAKTYFRLGKIHSEVYKDLSLAAAYFDSSSSRVTNADYLESSFNAGQLASAYGSYSSLRNSINRLDSLLWLGSLRSAELDSVLNEIRQQRQQDINERTDTEDNRVDRLINIANAGESTTIEDQASFEYGFLNYKNARLKRESISGFTAIWGNRPLVDNWRRMEAVRNSNSSSTDSISSDEGNVSVPLSNGEDERLAIDVSEIPTSREQLEAYIRQLVNAKYELGNLFFITLDMPDSAKTYFIDIVRNYPKSALVPQSMYSLFEINSETGDSQRADYWGQRILREYPSTRYAEQVNSRLNAGEQEEAEDDSSQVLISRLQRIEASADTISPDKAEQFRELAVAHRSTQMAPFIHYRAIKTYVELAKMNTDPELYQKFLAAREAEGGSLEPDSTEWASYPFYGTYWDSVRTVINEHDTMFTEKTHTKELEVLRQALNTSRLPAEPQARVSSVPQPKTEKEINACNELEGVEIVGGTSNFLARLDFPDDIQRNELPEAVTYEILISGQGRVTDYKRVSRSILPGVGQVLENAMSRYLLFDPVMVNDRITEVRCEITFPLRP